MAAGADYLRDRIPAMIRARRAAGVVVLLLGLVGCAGASSEASAANELTWQEAKARTQATELEIANSLPQGKVADVDHMATGVLLACGGSSVTWNGAATVTLTAGAEPEPLVRALEAKYRDSRFEIKVRDPAPAGHYEFQLRSPDSAEIYIIKRGVEPSTIRIASGSECFSWPEDESIDRDF
ncbi:hypothetical protein KKR91_03690 [Arthrobacter jiangjiafuii]|uniref:Uncharacterized protein n=1 Tax=Arthrobacter jiangjiafuii TaxID=2817475 RepID=A0A975M6N1_9MICC|nr:hypothetical protein [Arthrobacter jiangjiafuii]MBP3043707.1 hypothetical protein [Arthrobacter jiangjiafuii]QWC10739.1 hypothetical protein KKR91_03690 [Arthrobacter jiangjiafuii]